MNCEHICTGKLYANLCRCQMREVLSCHELSHYPVKDVLNLINNHVPIPGMQYHPHMSDEELIELYKSWIERGEYVRKGKEGSSGSDGSVN